MKSLTGIKALTSAQKLHYRTTLFEELLPMAASALKHDHDIIIIKIAESLKVFWYEEVVGRWIEITICKCWIIYGKRFPSFPLHRKKLSKLFLSNFVTQQILNFICEINCITAATTDVRYFARSKCKLYIANIGFIEL